MQNQDDDSVASAESRYYDPIDLTEDILEELKDDAAEYPVDSLYIVCNGDLNPNFQFDPLSIDWASDGHAISDNTSLHWLEIRDIDQSDREVVNERDQRLRIRNAKALYRAVAANKSIRYLTIEGNITHGLDMIDTLAILASFVQNNINLRSFVVGHFALSPRTTQLLASALSKSNTSLSTFGLKRCEGISGGNLSQILDAIKTCPHIESLILDENDISDDVAEVLGSALPTLNLRSVSLERDRDMMYGSITPGGVELISEGLKSSSLETLSFRGNHIGVEASLVLAESISKSAVKDLDLTWAVSPNHAEFVLSEQGWIAFFDSLQHCALCRLSLGGNYLKDENIVPFVESLNTMRSLSHLDLWGLRDLTVSGWCTFFKCLKQNRSLQTCNRYTHSLNADEDELVSAAITNTLCEKTSIGGIFRSNHTLEKVEDEDELSSECNYLLRMNKGTNKAGVARQKIIRYYFLGGNNLNGLLDMPLSLMPRVLEGIGKNGPQPIYELVGVLPSLLHNVGASCVRETHCMQVRSQAE